jgi:hypothetical protein
MKSPIVMIYNFITILHSFDWVALIITIGVCITTMVVGLLVVSPMGAPPV